MLRILALLLCCVPLTAFAQNSSTTTPTQTTAARNVVLFVADDLGFQLGCYGDSVTKTPAFDRLAASGVRFTNAHCTTASCSASRSVLLTGLFNHATGHFGHSHGYSHFSTYESVPTLPLMLSGGGYRTCSIGKYHVAPEQVYHFDAYRNAGVQGNRNGVRMAANAKAWIEEDDTPFFLYFCSSDPHRGVGTDGFSNFNDDPDHYPGVERHVFDPQTIPVPDWLPDTQIVRQELAEYYQAVNRLDQGLGALLDVLEETGHADDTLVIVLADNGPPFPGAKTTLYQPGMNLPLIVRDPYSDLHGTTTAALVDWADVTPTILAWCGVKPARHVAVTPNENDGVLDTQGPLRPVAFHGRSFVAAFKEEQPESFDAIFGSHTFHEITNYYPMRVYRQGDYKLIFNIAHQLPYPFASDLYDSPTWQETLTEKRPYYGKRRTADYIQRPRFELFNLANDPDELHNLADDPTQQDRLKTMQSALQKWQQATDDPWELKWRYE